MIDPTPWKKELHRVAAQVESYVGKRSLGHQSKSRMERLLMQGFYLLHKLFEDHRVDEDLAGNLISVTTLPSAGRITYLADHQSIYTTLAGAEHDPSSLHLGVLTNKIIHSYLILPILGESGLQSVAICSEFEHFDRIIIVPLASLISSLRAFSSH